MLEILALGLNAPQDRIYYAMTSDGYLYGLSYLDLQNTRKMIWVHPNEQEYYRAIFNGLGAEGTAPIAMATRLVGVAHCIQQYGQRNTIAVFLFHPAFASCRYNTTKRKYDCDTEESLMPLPFVGVYLIV